MKMKSITLIGLLVFWLILPCLFGSAEVFAKPHAPETSDTFNIRDFGAVGDGVANDGPALQLALDALAEAGGGTLLVPAGRYAIVTPVVKNFSGLASSVVISGVESSTPVPPPTATGEELSRGLDLVSEFAPRTGTSHIAISLTGLDSLLVHDITFIGTPDVTTDAIITLELTDIAEARVKHCEFYAVSSLVWDGAIVQAVRSHLMIEKSVFLGCAANSGVNGSVVQNLEWKGITVAEAIFIDYGQRELFGKLGYAAPFSWIGIGNAAAKGPTSPRREVVVRSVFLDEGALNALSSRPFLYQPATSLIDLVYVSGIFVNVSNLQSSGHYFEGLQNVLIEKSHYGWSHAADAAINLVSAHNAILDQVECVDDADTIIATSLVGTLTVINSQYENLESQALATNAFNTATLEEDPVQYVRQSFLNALSREPDPAGHFYWSNKLLGCGADEQCLADKQGLLSAYLASAPSPTFSIAGTVTDENGAAVGGVIVALSGFEPITTQTDSTGKYLFSGLPTSGEYVVTASRNNYTIQQPTHSIVTPSGNRVADFAATINRYLIGGHVENTSGLPITGAVISLTGSQTGSQNSDANGDYLFTVLAEGDYTVTISNPNYTFAPSSATFNNLGSNKSVHFVGTAPNFIEFSATSYSVGEGVGTATITVTRHGDTSRPAEVSYLAVNGSAEQGDDMSPVIGTLNFAAGQTSSTIEVLVTDDGYTEGVETLNLTLSHAIGALLGTNTAATLSINDNDSSQPVTNPVDQAQFFVRQHYRDFLSREPDQSGLDFWSGQITICGTDAACIADRRMNVSAAFFLSIEFQETGFLVHRLYRASYNLMPEHTTEFLLDSREIGNGVVVNAPGWEALLETNKASFIQSFVSRAQFTELYPMTLTPAEFVAALNASAGGPLSSIEITAAISEFGSAPASNDIPARARVLRRVVENETLRQRELNPAFVMMQYFGYLQRNPSDPPDNSLAGYDFWLNKLNEFGGDFRRAEMVKSFLVSTEYRARFGNP